ncbi:hypothetical protein LBYZC6_04790 [Lacrimispora brassicae]
MYDKPEIAGNRYRSWKTPVVFGNTRHPCLAISATGNIIPEKNREVNKKRLTGIPVYWYNWLRKYKLFYKPGGTKNERI